MFTFYLACLLFGGILLAFSFFGGGEHDSDVEHSLADGHDADLLGSGSDTAIEPAHAMHPDLAHQYITPADAVKFFSFRNIVFFIAFFGLTGTVLNLIGILSVFTFFFSGAMGAFAWLTGYKLHKYLANTESGESLNLYSLKGKTARVSLYCSKTQKGKIIISVGAQSIEITALVDENCLKDEFQSRENVLIVDINKDTAYITDVDF